MTAQLRQRLPKIVVNDRPQRDVIEDAWSSLLAQPGFTLFNRCGHLVRLVKGERGPEVAVESTDTLNGRLLRTADWFRQTRGGRYHGNPPAAAVRDMLVNPDPRVPKLTAVSTVPALLPSGKLVSGSGFHEASGIYLAPVGLSEMPKVPEAPTDLEVARARDLILGGLLRDFPFVAEPDRAHSVAAMLHPHVRLLIDGPTPGKVYEAPTPGSGKGLLVECTSLIATGQIAPTCSLPRDEDEIRRTLTAELSKGRPVIWLDNLDSSGRTIHSPTLAAVLTTTLWSDRQIRTSNKLDLPNRGLWIFTGNNPRFSMELTRRLVRIRIDPGVERPWLRDGFRHPDLRGWVRENRPQLVHALLILATAWQAAGRPRFTGEPLGTFESWAAVMGGILEVAGISGFLGNLIDLYAENDAESDEWREFVAAWWERFKSKPVSPDQLLSVCATGGLMESMRGAGSPQSQLTKLGLALKFAHDRVFGRWRIRRVRDKGRHKGRSYALALVDRALFSVGASDRAKVPAGPPSGPLPDSAEESHRLSVVGGPWGPYSPLEEREDLKSIEPDTVKRRTAPAGPGPHVPEVPQVPATGAKLS